MTKEITKSFILQEMQDKLKLREMIPSKFSFSEEVVPTYNIEQHLEKWVTEYCDVSITSGPSGFLFYTVPSNERWFLYAYNIVFMAAGAYKVTGLYTYRVGTSSFYLDMVKGQTVSYAKLLPAPLTLNAGDKIYVYIDDYTSTANLRLFIEYMKEEIR